MSGMKVKTSPIYPHEAAEAEPEAELEADLKIRCASFPTSGQKPGVRADTGH